MQCRNSQDHSNIQIKCQNLSILTDKKINDDEKIILTKANLVFFCLKKWKTLPSRDEKKNQIKAQNF